MQNLQAELKVQDEKPRKNLFLGKVGRPTVGMHCSRIKRLVSVDQPGGPLVVSRRQGLEKVIEIQLIAAEKSAPERSAASVRELMSSLRV